MKGKYFCVDKNGMVLISKKELDEALNDAYNEGFQAGKNSTYYYWGPYNTPYVTCTSTLTDLDKDKITIKC